MSPQALTITLNVRDEANRISASVAGGARFFCHLEDIGDPDAEEMFGYDVGHNFPSWPLAISPTYFNTNEAIHLHIAIPREDRGDSQAMVVFPSEVLDLWGYACNAVPMQDEEGNYIDEHGNIVARAEDAATAYVRKKQEGTETDADPIGSQDYYYIYLQGRLTASGAAGTTPREWDPMYATGLLNTDETWGEVITIDQLAKEMKKKVDVEWFMRIFTIHGTDRRRHKAEGSDEWETDEDGNIIYTGDGEAMVIRPNDMTHEITDTESMFGTWTEQFISALGKGSGSGGGGGGGGGDALEWPLQDINVAGMPKVNETGGPEAGDTIVWDGQTFVWGAGLDTTKLAAWLVANDYKKQTELDLRYLKLVAPSQTITGNLNLQGDLTIARTPISDFEHLADGIVLTFGEAKAFFDTRYITVTFWNRLFATYNGTTQVQANGAGLIDNLKILVGTWTEEFISALGTGSAGGGGGVAYLSMLEDVTLTDPANGDILQFDGQNWLNIPMPSTVDMTQVWAALATGGNQQIDASHLATALSGLFTSLAMSNNDLYITIGGVTRSLTVGFYTDSYHPLADSATNAGHATSADTASYANQLATSRTLWGQSFDGTANVSGSLSDTGNITPSANNTFSIGASGNQFASLWASRLYLTGSIYFEVDRDGHVHLAGAGFYTDSFVSALGTGSAGGASGVAYLSQLEDVSLSNPVNGQILQFNGSQWVNAVLPSGTDMAAVWSALAASDSSHQIDYSHLSGAISINNGTITIGSQSITPVSGNFLPLTGGTLTGTLTGTKFHSNANSSIDLTHIPSDSEIALETGNGDGGVSAWIWREQYSSSNWGIFHDNSYDVIHFVGNSTSRFSINLGTGDVKVGTNDVIHSGNIASQTVNKANFLNADDTQGASNWVWNPLNLTQYYVWGQQFANSYLSGDTGDMRLYLASINEAGGLGICINIDGYVSSLSGFYTDGGYKKGGSSDSYVLLGGGGHAAISALSVNYANSANFANYVYCSSHIGSWRLSSDWDGSYFWLTAKYDSNSLLCATAYATSAGTASSANYASSAGRLSGDSSYTAWGQGFWSYGTPNSISGNMSGVGDIQCTAGSRIHGNGGALYIGNADNASWVQIADMCSQSGSSYWSIYASGSASFQSVYSTGAVSSLSDIRYKDIVRHFALNIEAIANASIIQFRWKESHDTDTHVGGIAQEWRAILPDAVHETKDGKLAMDYGTIAYTSAVSLARKVVEQQKEIDDLKERLARLEALLTK